MAARILVVGMNYAPEIAGVGRYTGDLAQELAKRGHDVAVVTTPPHYPGWRVQASHRNRYSRDMVVGVLVHRCPLLLRQKMQGLWRLVAPLSFAISSAPVILWRILRDRPEVVLCVEPTLFSAPAVAIGSRLAGARTVLHVQDLEVDAAFAVGHLDSIGWVKSFAAAFERFFLKRFDSIVTISSRMAEKLAEKGLPSERIAIVRNWVDLDHIRPVETSSPYRQELGLDAQAFLVLYSGSIGAKQGLELLVEAARILKDDRTIMFAVAGEGPAKAGLVECCRDLPNVRFLPFQPYERLADFLGLADLHVLTQDAGAADLVLPSKLGGMLASGWPILITADAGTELATFVDGAAWVIPPGDAAILARAVAEAAERGETAKGMEGRLALARLLSRRDALDAFEAILLTGGKDKMSGDAERKPAIEASL
jgi:colanic acid biosynthesis glycosyl transferase WcaI